MATNNKKEAKNIQYLRRKAVKDAWAREVKLVKQGKATRNWTLEQQRELILTGRVKGFIGHHEKSVKNFPQYAGDQKNIQFLTRKEHYTAHLGNWKWSLGNHFDPETKSIKLENSDSVALAYVNLKEKLSEQEKTELYKQKKLLEQVKLVYNNPQETKKNTMLATDYKKEFNQIKNNTMSLFMSIYERDKNQTALELANTFSREFPFNSLNTEQKNEICMTMAYNLKNNSTAYVNAFSEKVATDTMKNKYDSINRSTANGTTKVNENYKSFADARVNECDNNVKISSLNAENTNKALNDAIKNTGQFTQAEIQNLKNNDICANKVNALYKDQQQKWQMSSSAGKSLDNNQSNVKSQSNTQSKNQSNTQSKNQSNTQPKNQTNTQPKNQSNTQSNTQSNKRQ